MTTSQFMRMFAIGEKRSRWRHRRPTKQAHLAAMGMAGELQRHPRRDAPGHVRLVRQQHDRRVVGNFCQRRAEIVDADAPHRAEAARRNVSQLIAEASEPELSETIRFEAITLRCPGRRTIRIAPDRARARQGRDV